MHKIIYVEDEIYLAKVVKESLERLGHDVMHMPDGRGILSQIELFKPDICVLDIMLPHKTGYEIAKEIRSYNLRLPIIFLTAKDQTQDLIKGFDSGGNDYLRKPFSIEELNIRINNLVNMVQAKAANKEVNDKIYLGAHSIFYPPKQLLVCGQYSNRLSFKTSLILGVLCRNINATTLRKDLLIEVWNDDSYFNSRNLDVYIRKLRQIISADSNLNIITLKGVGYHFVVE